MLPPSATSIVLGLVSSATFASAFPFTLPFGILSKRATLDPGAVVGFSEAVPSGLTGTLMKKYKPWLNVHNGCVPFPAVDSNGNVGAGLDPKNSGDENDGCSSNLGQVYARAGTSNGAYGIMYSWYMPKDRPAVNVGGHRHDWENVIVWLSSQSESATVRGVAISAHGEYQKVAGHFDGTRPLVGYISFVAVNHQLIDETTKGGQQPLIAWESMTDAARSGIANTNWESATPSFRDDNFQSYLDQGFF